MYLFFILDWASHYIWSRTSWCQNVIIRHDVWNRCIFYMIHWSLNWTFFIFAISLIISAHVYEMWSVHKWKRYMFAQLDRHMIQLASLSHLISCPRNLHLLLNNYGHGCGNVLDHNRFILIKSSRVLLLHIVDNWNDNLV